MAVIQVSAAAATAVAGYDLMTNNILKTVNRPRRIRRAGLTGSAVVGDCEVRLLAGGQQIGNLFNSTLAPMHADADMYPVNEVCPANQPLTGQMVTGGTTNIVYLTIETD
jgi:hypothetical protein